MSNTNESKNDAIDFNELSNLTGVNLRGGASRARIGLTFLGLLVSFVVVFVALGNINNLPNHTFSIFDFINRLLDAPIVDQYVIRIPSISLEGTPSWLIPFVDFINSFLIGPLNGLWTVFLSVSNVLVLIGWILQYFGMLL